MRNLGVSQSLLGNTAVAASVEAEEVARVAVPARRPEVGLGDISATIVHFAAFNADVVALVKPPRLGRDTTHFYLLVAAASPAVFAGLLLARKQIGRTEGAGLIGL